MLQVITGRVTKPRKIVLYGVGGIGKNTWASGAPKPLIIQTEDGSNDIGTDRLPVCRTLAEFQQHVRSVLLDEHDYKTLIIDTANGVEALIHTSVTASTGTDSISSIGYGRGYEAAVGDVRKVLFMLDKIADVRGMYIIILAHAKIERFEDPGNEAYDRYSMALHKRAAAVISQWADEVLFANYKTFVRKTEQGFRERNVAVGTGERFLFTREMPAYYAKNRLGLPAEMPMPNPRDGGKTGWQMFAEYLGDKPRTEQDQEAGAAAPVAAATATDAVSSEPAGQAPASPPADLVEQAAAAGLEVVDLEAMDVAGLRQVALPMAFRMSAKNLAAMKRAIAAEDAAAMREIIRYTMSKPDTSGIEAGGDGNA